jgi:glycosyltransferase involved in cell wall biosynthesis
MVSPESPQISVVIPVYNRAGAVVRALQTAAAQTFTDYEIIVVDDGSTDDTVAAVEQSGVAGLVLVRHPRNLGAAAARNTGIRTARGRWIAFLDSDDVWMSDKLARQVAALRDAPADTLACATAYVLHREGRQSDIRINLTPGQFRTEILFGCAISPGTTLMVDRRAFDAIGLFDEDFRRLEDWDWLLRYVTKYDLVYVPELLADVYLAPDYARQSRKQVEPVLKAIDRIGAKHLATLGSGVRERQLRSSLEVERAGIMYRTGRPVRAALNVIASFLTYPKRNAAFFRMLGRSILSLVKR